MQNNLTKENFWNELYEKYPVQMQKFCEWIDNYKKENNWEKLFNDSYHQSNKKFASNGELVSIDFSTPKYHDLPIAMQIGIFMEFASHEKEIYGMDVNFLPEIDTDVESMHKWSDMPDLIREFFRNVSTIYPKTNGKKYIGICEKSPAGGTNIGDIWVERNDGLYSCETRASKTMNRYEINLDVSNGYLKEIQ